MSLAIGSQLLGQVGNTDAIVYKKCYLIEHPAIKTQSPKCGVDEEATAAAQVKQKATEKLRQEIADRNNKLTPQNEVLVEQAMEERFVSSSMRKTESLQRVVDTAQSRIDGLLTLSWPTQDVSALERLGDRFAAHAESLSESKLSRSGFRQLRDKVYSDTKDLQTIAVRKLRNSDRGKPIENIVTRIDALVATVGTVLGEVDKEGVAIPAQVRTGYEQAKKAIRQAKETCSMRRPKACRQLWEVLFAIESISEPLCDLPSDRLDPYCRG